MPLQNHPAARYFVMSELAKLISIIAGLLVSLVVIYVAVRVASAAFFKSKQEFERKPK